MYLKQVIFDFPAQPPFVHSSTCHTTRSCTHYIHLWLAHPQALAMTQTTKALAHDDSRAPTPHVPRRTPSWLLRCRSTGVGDAPLAALIASRDRVLGRLLAEGVLREAGGDPAAALARSQASLQAS